MIIVIIIIDVFFPSVLLLLLLLEGMRAPSLSFTLRITHIQTHITYIKYILYMHTRIKKRHVRLLQLLLSSENPRCSAHCILIQVKLQTIRQARQACLPVAVVLSFILPVGHQRKEGSSFAACPFTKT